MSSKTKRFRITTRDASAKPKVVLDLETGFRVERVKSIREHKCANNLCPYFMNTIDSNLDYALVVDPQAPAEWISGRQATKPKKYHNECVPDPAREALKVIQDAW